MEKILSRIEIQRRGEIMPETETLIILEKPTFPRHKPRYQLKMNQYKQPFLALGLFILSLLPIFADGQVRMRTDVGSRVLGEIMPEDSSEHRHIVDSLIEDVSSGRECGE